MTNSEKQFQIEVLKKLNQLKQPESEQQKEDQIKHHYDSYRQYIMSLIGFAVGFGSFWRFPYLIYKNGGGVFFIPYFFSLFVLGIPLLYLETSTGQMHQKSVPFIYKQINRGLKWVGITYLLVCFHMAGYYNIILVYSYRYILSVFHSQLPYANQSALDNTYLTKQVLNKSSSISEFGGINLLLFFLYAMSLLICYFIVKQGVKTSGKIATVTALMPYLFFFILLIRASPLQGAYSGLKYLFYPKWEKLFGLQIWVDATVQVFYQMSLAHSGIINLSSLKPKKQHYIEGVYIIPASIVICGLLCALIIFMYLGHFSNEIGLSIQQLKLSGPQLSFNVFPKALAILPWPNLWVLLFFIAMVFLGIDTQFAYLQTIFCYLRNQTKYIPLQIAGKQIPLQNAKKYVMCLVFCFCPFLTSYAGIYYMQYFDYFTCTIPYSVGALIQLYAFVYLLPFSQLQKETYKYTNTTAPKWIRTILESKLIVIILSVNVVMAFINQLFLYKVYSMGFYIVGWIISLYPYILAYIYWMLNREEKSKRTFQDIKNRNSYL